MLRVTGRNIGVLWWDTHCGALCEDEAKEKRTAVLCCVLRDAASVYCGIHTAVRCVKAKQSGRGEQLFSSLVKESVIPEQKEILREYHFWYFCKVFAVQQVEVGFVKWSTIVLRGCCREHCRRSYRVSGRTSCCRGVVYSLIDRF